MHRQLRYVFTFAFAATALLQAYPAQAILTAASMATPIGSVTVPTPSGVIQNCPFTISFAVPLNATLEDGRLRTVQTISYGWSVNYATNSTATVVQSSSPTQVIFNPAQPGATGTQIATINVTMPRIAAGVFTDGRFIFSVQGYNSVASQHLQTPVVTSSAIFYVTCPMIGSFQNHGP